MQSSTTVIASQARTIYKHKSKKKKKERKIRNCRENMFYELSFSTVYLHNNCIKVQFFIY
jgi:hypothetical protein